MRNLLITLTLLFLTIGSYYIYNKSYAVPPISEASNSINAISYGLKDNEKSKEYISPISIEYLRSINFHVEPTVIEEELAPGSNYKRYIASYLSDGNKIFGLLTIPNEEPSEGGYKAIVFSHGYIPPSQYVTTEKYIAYVDSLAKSGFVVFKIDLRGHGDSEGYPSGSYFSNAYTIDAISALKSLQKRDDINPNSIGMWGHSMSGNLVLRAMLVNSDIKAGVIWAGAVYSYEDYEKYRISDNSYVRGSPPTQEDIKNIGRENSEEIAKLRDPDVEVDFDSTFWKSISLTRNIKYLDSPIQLHHAVNDDVVNIGYSKDLATILEQQNKEYEFYEYAGGGHNIESPYFETAIARTIKFFEDNL